MKMLGCLFLAAALVSGCATLKPSFSGEVGEAEVMRRVAASAAESAYYGALADEYRRGEKAAGSLKAPSRYHRGLLANYWPEDATFIVVGQIGFQLTVPAAVPADEKTRTVRPSVMRVELPPGNYRVKIIGHQTRRERSAVGAIDVQTGDQMIADYYDVAAGALVNEATYVDFIVANTPGY